MGIKNIHITGGEPSLHPNILSIIHSFKGAGLSVGMTTHGEIGRARFQQILDSGIDSINFSLHAITPEQYLKMDLIAQQYAASSPESALRYASGRLSNKLRNIQTAVDYARSSQGHFAVKTNTVVQDLDTTLGIVRWCNEVGVSPRLQRDLNNKTTSQAIIDCAVQELGAIPVAEDVAIGDSSGSGVAYEYPGGAFKIKLFGDVYIPSMCNSCDLKDTDACRERFYGIRVEHDRVSTCIDMSIPGITSFTAEEFIGGANSVVQDIMLSYAQARTARQPS